MTECLLMALSGLFEQSNRTSAFGGIVLQNYFECPSTQF